MIDITTLPINSTAASISNLLKENELLKSQLSKGIAITGLLALASIGIAVYSYRTRKTIKEEYEEAKRVCKRNR
jgi:hypothetical protein